MHQAENYLHLVEGVLNKYYGGGEFTAKRLGMDREDLFQIGCIGLIKACHHFKTEEGAKFETYAFIKIYGELRRYIRDDTNVVKFSKKVRELAGSAMKLDDRSPENIAAVLGVDSETAMDLYFYITRYKVSLFKPVGDNDFSTLTLIETIEGYEDCAKPALRYIELHDRLSILNDKQQRICIMLLDGKTQVEVARDLGISQTHVARLLKKAIIQIQNEYEVAL